VTIGLATARRFQWRDVPGYVYVMTQVAASALAAAALFLVANGKPGFTVLGAAIAGASYAVLLGARQRAPRARVTAAGDSTAG
jgi:aquaporin Z